MELSCHTLLYTGHTCAHTYTQTHTNCYWFNSWLYVSIINVYLRSLFNFQIKGISNCPFSCPLYRSLNKLIINLLFNINPRASTTTLTHVKEQTKMADLDSFINCKKKDKCSDNVTDKNTRHQKLHLWININEPKQDCLPIFPRPLKWQYIFMSYLWAERPRRVTICAYIQ